MSLQSILVCDGIGFPSISSKNMADCSFAAAEASSRSGITSMSVGSASFIPVKRCRRSMSVRSDCESTSISASCARRDRNDGDAGENGVSATHPDLTLEEHELHHCFAIRFGDLERDGENDGAEIDEQEKCSPNHHLRLERAVQLSKKHISHQI